MEITDKLRELAKALNHWWYNPLKDEYTCTTSITPPSIHAINLAGSILSIADRIDAEHEEAIASVMNDALYHANDKDMADLGWVRLPKVSKESTGKRITDELREWARNNTVHDKVLTTYPVQHPVHGTVESLLRIADLIDAEHEDALASKVARAISVGEDGTEFVSMPAKELSERYMELPKDADSEYIHEHDKVDWRDHSGTWHKNVLVVAVCSDGCYVMDGMVFHVHASDIRHHHAPTIEDVLLDMHRRLSDVSELYDVDSDELEDEYTSIIEEFAAKLRLADDEKEQQ